MNQPIEPPIPFEQFADRVLTWAFNRIQEDAQRRGLPRVQVQNLICNYAIAYLDNQEGKQP